ncbi:ubiquinone biosynthesis O-methyltransferase [Thermogutta terrifontis]|uniref:Ubiquinone biosynthesis O-methyltransferase n=2 Tax=Thermogutta terrifontis TaxID=1331910 RepID=A0A286RG65_9BACT|nr:ubiquinone biosynthesis O-methyltransferase [Thermogutta terrifontis]
MDDRPLYEQQYEKMLYERSRIAERLACQIIDTCSPYLSKPVSEWEVLDCGSGYGFTAAELAKRCKRVKGIEPSHTLYVEAVRIQQEKHLANLSFANIGAETLSDHNVYDLVVLDNVLEHIREQLQALQRIFHALRPNGVLFIVVPNKLWPIEVHYRLPFLSYLPLSLANIYLRLTGKGTDYSDACYAPTFWTLRRLLNAAGFREFYFVVPANLANTMKGDVWYYRLGARLLRRIPLLWIISKAFVVVAIKR